MKAIHNSTPFLLQNSGVVLYPKDTEKWKQFTTVMKARNYNTLLFCIPKILKNESNSQHSDDREFYSFSCFVSQRYWKMKAIHNYESFKWCYSSVVLYPKDTEKWKQFTTRKKQFFYKRWLFCIPKILKNESNSQLRLCWLNYQNSCFVSQRYWKMKAIHNGAGAAPEVGAVVLYPKDTEKWKQFTT